MPGRVATSVVPRLCPKSEAGQYGSVAAPSASLLTAAATDRAVFDGPVTTKPPAAVPSLLQP